MLPPLQVWAESASLISHRLDYAHPCLLPQNFVLLCPFRTGVEAASLGSDHLFAYLKIVVTEKGLNAAAVVVAVTHT